MRIGSSQLTYAASHEAVSSTAVVEQQLISPRALRQIERSARDSVELSGATNTQSQDDLSELGPKEKLAVLAVEAMLGHKIRYYRSARGGGASAGNGNGAAAVAAPARQRTEVHSESEQTNFAAKGVVQTTDGRRIEFAAQLTMSREFQSVSSTVTGGGKATDPLVVNFGAGPSLSGAKIDFDLNGDGSKESINFVGSGSGFLALDKNGDGKINDGSELFGPGTGNGFGELSAYDVDHNGWIDENDPIFAKLKIWSVDGLSSAAEKGLGAISTASAETPFSIKDTSNVLEAEVRRTGIYLFENGNVGTVQELDLVAN